MRFLLLGQGGDYASTGFLTAYSLEQRDLSICRGLARLGHDCTIGTIKNGMTDDKLVKFVKRSDMEVSKYDCVILTSGWESDQSLLVQGRLTDHPNVMFVAYELQKHYPFVRAGGFQTPLLVEKQTRESTIKCFYLPWGFPFDEIDKHDTSSPWKDKGEKRLLFSGAVLEGFDGRWVKMFNALAEHKEYEVWIAGLFALPGRFGGITDEERRKHFNERVRFASDVCPMPLDYRTYYFPNLNGPVKFEDVARLARHADVGLSLSIDDHMVLGHTKLMDYLACGLPVVAEKGSPTNGHIVMLRAGEIVPWNDPGAVHEAVLRVLKAKHDRNKIEACAREYLSWDYTVRMIESHAREGC